MFCELVVVCWVVFSFGSLLCSFFQDQVLRWGTNMLRSYLNFGLIFKLYLSSCNFNTSFICACKIFKRIRWIRHYTCGAISHWTILPPLATYSLVFWKFPININRPWYIWIACSCFLFTNTLTAVRYKWIFKKYVISGST